MDGSVLIPYLNYAASTAGFYLMLAAPAAIVRLAWWYGRFRREAASEGFARQVPADALGKVGEREVPPRVLEYWHEPLCWVHVLFGLICIRIAPIPALVLIFALLSRGWLTTAENLQVIFFAGALLFFLVLWVRTARGIQYSVSEEGIAFKPGMRGEAVMRWGDITEAFVYGSRPMCVVVTGRADDGKERTLMLYNGFYKRADFEPIVVKLMGRNGFHEEAPATQDG